jgi:hypothetical protein
MAKEETVSSRLPRSIKPVSHAFFTALEAVPEASWIAVAKAANTMIRDEMKARREKLEARVAKKKAPKPVATGRSAVTKLRKSASMAVVAAASKRRLHQSAAVTSGN